MGVVEASQQSTGLEQRATDGRAEARSGGVVLDMLAEGCKEDVEAVEEKRGRSRRVVRGWGGRTAGLEDSILVTSSLGSTAVVDGPRAPASIRRCGHPLHRPVDWVQPTVPGPILAPSSGPWNSWARIRAAGADATMEHGPGNTSVGRGS